MSKCKIGLIGFGTWTTTAYLPALQCDGRAIITAVTASTEKSRQYARQLLGNDIVLFNNYEELLEQPNLDAIMIAVPDNIHQAALTAALDSGIPVFYEPPISDSPQQIPNMIQRLLAAPQVTYAHLELSFHPAITYAVQLMKLKTIGTIQNVTVTLNADWGRPKDSNICFMNRMSCWYVDLLNKIIGTLPERVLVLDGYGCLGRMQSTSIGIYDYGGIWGIFKANINNPKGVSIYIEIVGDNGEITIDYFTGELRYRSLQFPEWITEHYSALTPHANWPGVRETISTFLDSVISKNTLLGNAQNVAQLNRIGLASEESTDTKTWATIKKL